MSQSSVADGGIKFSVVEEIVDKEGRHFSIEVKFSKKFLKVNSLNKKDTSISSYIRQSLMTKREIQVLKYIAEGNNNTQIAKKLNVSVHTAKVHVQNIFKKLSVSDRTAAVVEAIRLHLIRV